MSPTKWNNDWDGSPLVIDDYLFEGGENSQFHVVKLNRDYGPDGRVTVAPELVFNTPGWDDELIVGARRQRGVDRELGRHLRQRRLLRQLGRPGAGLGHQRAGRRVARPTRVFRFWTGDDTDASVVIDDEGMLYVASEYERGTDRSREVGQLMKLDPSQPDAPLVWSMADNDRRPGGLWATPALHRDVVYVATNGGELVAPRPR